METPKQYYKQVDGLRAIAILAVLFQHFAYLIAGKLKAGFFGVDLFFVLSGFLITEILLQQKDKQPTVKIFKNFYIRRSLRIFPVYYLLCIVYVIFLKEFKAVSLYAFTYTLNYIEFFTHYPVPGFATHFWSLCVEEQFYLFWPFFIVLIPSRWFLPSFIIIILASILCLLYSGNDHITPSRLYELCGGGLLAYLKVYYNEIYVSRKKILSSLLILVIIGFFIKVELGISCISVLLVYWASIAAFKGLASKFLHHPWIVHIGKVSYGIYVYHKIIAHLFTVYIFDAFWTKIDFSFMPVLRWHSWIIKFPLYTLLAIVFASLSYKYFEAPFLKLKSRFSN